MVSTFLFLLVRLDAFKLLTCLYLYLTSASAKHSQYCPVREGEKPGKRRLRLILSWKSVGPWG